MGQQTLVVFASHDADRVRPTASVLREVFGLSAAEADIAVSLAAGEAPEAISARRGGTIATVRTQIKHVMLKLGVRRQAEIASQLAHSVAVLRRD